MIDSFVLRGLLVASLFAAPAFVIAADQSGGDHPMSDGRDWHERMNPVERARKHLDELEQELHLKADQQAAWKTYADTALARATDRAKRMEDFHAGRGEPRGDMDTATRLEQMSQRMRDRADELQQMARDTRAFQQALTPEQQTIFDLYWESQFRGRGMMRRRN